MEITEPGQKWQCFPCSLLSIMSASTSMDGSCRVHSRVRCGLWYFAATDVPRMKSRILSRRGKTLHHKTLMLIYSLQIIYIYGFCCCVGNARSISSFPSQYLFIYYRSWGRRTTCSTVMNFCTFTVNERAEIQTPARNCVELCLNASELSSHCGLAPGWIDLENNKFLHCKWKE